MIAEYIMAALLILGGFFCFVAGLGVLRLPDVLIRMHASTKAGTLGAGLILAAVVFAVIIGGIKSIARVTEKIVPFMAFFYCFFAIIVILMNFASIPEAIANIFSGAFTGDGVKGGAIGALIIGFQRAVFSNEAGIGSASIAHSAVRTPIMLSGSTPNRCMPSSSARMWVLPMR